MPKLESLAFIPGNPAQATVYMEARGPIIGVATVNYENGDSAGHFGVVHRLSNIATLTISQRPQEPGDVGT